MNNLKSCTKCGHLVALSAPKCPGCGTDPNPKPSKTKKNIAAIVTVLVLAACIRGCVGCYNVLSTPVVETARDKCEIAGREMANQQYDQYSRQTGQTMSSHAYDLILQSDQDFMCKGS